MTHLNLKMNKIRGIFNALQCYSEVYKTRTNLLSLRFSSKGPDTHGEQMGGFELRDEIVPFKSKWRTPLSERTGFVRSKLEAFKNMQFQGGLYRYHPSNFKFMNSVTRWLGLQSKQKLIFDQRFVEDRLKILGCDLAAAHFLVFRGGAVKFCHTDWIRDNKNRKEYDVDLPNLYDDLYKVEALDFTGMNIQYEGLQNIENLSELRWLSFHSCISFDNWCLDRISGEFKDKLEYLDVSETKVTHHGLQALYRCDNLTTLKVHGLNQDTEFLQMCLQLQKFLPDLNIEGISFEVSKGQDDTLLLEERERANP